MPTPPPPPPDPFTTSMAVCPPFDIHGFKRLRLTHLPLRNSANLSFYPPSPDPSVALPSFLALASCSSDVFPPFHDFTLSGCESTVTDGKTAPAESSRTMHLPGTGHVSNLNFNRLASNQRLSTISPSYHISSSWKIDRSDKNSLQVPNFLQIGSEIADNEFETRNGSRIDGGLRKMVNVPRKVDSAMKSSANHPSPYLYQFTCDEDIPMVDEGSTSNGNYIQPFLSEHQALNSPFEHLLPNALPAAQVASTPEMINIVLSLETPTGKTSKINGPAEGSMMACGFTGCGKRSRDYFLSSVCHDGGKMCSQSGSTIFCHPNDERCLVLGCTPPCGNCCGSCCSKNECQHASCGKQAQEREMLCEVFRGSENHVMEVSSMDSKGSSVSACKLHEYIQKCRSEDGAVCSNLHNIATPDDERCSLEGCTVNARENTLCCGENGCVCCFLEHLTGERRKCSWGGGEDKSMHSGNNEKLWTYFKGSCDRYAKATLGFCAEHRALVEDRRVHGSVTFGGPLSARFEVDPVNDEASDSINKETDAVDDEAYSCESGSPSTVSGGEHFMEEEHKVAFFSSIFAGVPSQSLTLGTSTDIRKHIPRKGLILKSCVSLPNVLGYASMGQPSSSKSPGIMQNNISDMEDDSIFNMSSLDLPDERVHGGNLMALIGKSSDMT